MSRSTVYARTVLTAERTVVAGGVTEWDSLNAVDAFHQSTGRKAWVPGRPGCLWPHVRLGDGDSYYEPPGRIVLARQALNVVTYAHEMAHAVDWTERRSRATHDLRWLLLFGLTLERLGEHDVARRLLDLAAPAAT